MQAGRWWAWVRTLGRDPEAWTAGLQLVKTVAAAVVAWVLAAHVLGLPQPFLAPWSAMLVVHFTVHASLTRGLQQMVSAVAGVVLAWAIWHALGGGMSPAVLAVALLLSLVFAQLRWVKEEGTTAATTALFVLTTGFGDNSTALLARLLDTGIGLGVGLAVNLLVWPPLLDLSAARAITAIRAELADLLSLIAAECHDGCKDEDVDAWVERSRQLDGEVAQAWALVRLARESGRFNPRRHSRTVRESRNHAAVLDRTEQSLSETRSLARTLGHSVTDAKEWNPRFRERWTALLEETAEALREPGDARLGEIRGKLATLAEDFSDEDLSGRHWTEYGGLILNLRNIATEMDPVAGSDPVSEATRGPLGVPAL
jgi:uncharacterized membrane protein YgaE (UPF0421/DUF939 family)